MPRFRWKTSLKRLKGITKEEITQLGVAEIHDQPGLLKAFDEREDAPIRSIATATKNQDHKMDETRIVELLGDSLVRTSKPLIAGHFRIHWADYLFTLAAALMIIGLVPWLRTTAEMAWDDAWDAVPKFLWGEPKPETKTPSVVAASRIVALATLTDDNMKISNGASEQQSKRMTALKGRYTLVPIAGGTPIKDEYVSKGKLDFTSVRILRVALKNAPPIENQSFPRDVDALFSARDGTHTGAQIPVTLVALDPTPSAPTATLALDPKDASEVAKWIGSSDVYILMRP
jgi:hypothetical protein